MSTAQITEAEYDGGFFLIVTDEHGNTTEYGPFLNPWKATAYAYNMGVGAVMQP